MNILYLTFVLPLLGFLLLAFSGGRWSENVSAWIGTGAVSLSALVTLWVGMDFFCSWTRNRSLNTLDLDVSGELYYPIYVGT